MLLDEPRVKRGLIGKWRAGGMDTLVKAMPAGLALDGGRSIAYCTSYKFIVGQTPDEIERRVGFRANSKLAHGADIYVLQRLPHPEEFALRGHSNTPGGIPMTPQNATPDYPPGADVPQWEVVGLNQGFLSFLCRVAPGETSRYPVASLPRAD